MRVFDMSIGWTLYILLSYGVYEYARVEMQKTPRECRGWFCLWLPFLVVVAAIGCYYWVSLLCCCVVQWWHGGEDPFELLRTDGREEQPL